MVTAIKQSRAIRKGKAGYGAKEYPAEFGLGLVLTKAEILGPERAAELHRRGLRYAAAVMDGEKGTAFLFGATPGETRNAAGLLARAIGEMRMGWDATESLAAMMAIGNGRIYVQATDDTATGLSGYRWLFEKADGVSVLEGAGLAAGEIPDGVKPPKCGCAACGSRGGW